MTRAPVPIRRRPTTTRHPGHARFGLAVLATLLAVRCRPVILPRADPLVARPCAGGGPVTHSAFLIGDAGAPALPVDGSTELVDPVLRALRSDVAEAVASRDASRVVVLFLGDNVYRDGLPPAGHLALTVLALAGGERSTPIYTRCLADGAPGAGSAGRPPRRRNENARLA